jgi:hypothetical protein
LHGDKSYVSVFLDSPEAGWVPDHLNPKASFKLYFLNQAGNGEDFCKGRWDRTGLGFGVVSVWRAAGGAKGSVWCLSR